MARVFGGRPAMAMSSSVKMQAKKLPMGMGGSAWQKWGNQKKRPETPCFFCFLFTMMVNHHHHHSPPFGIICQG